MKNRAPVQHIPVGPVSLFVKDKVAVTTRRESFQGATPVVERVTKGGRVAWWGPGNNDPQRIIKDKNATSILSAIINMKTEMLVSGGLSYGNWTVDERTGQKIFRPQQHSEIEYWLQDTGSELYNYEATRDYFSYANAFAEFQLSRGKNYCTGITACDASHVRLGTMDKKGHTNTAYMADWVGGAKEVDGDQFSAVDPYDRSPVNQILLGGKFRYIIPLRFLGDGQFYYGNPSWNALRTNGWLDINKRIPELKKLLLENLLHLTYHIEIDERYWERKFPTWAKKSEADRLDLVTAEVEALNDACKGRSQGGALMSSMLGSNASGAQGQESMLKITPIKNSLLEGAYIEDSQEADFVICRDMGLPPPLFGISPSKSGQSAGSGSADRILRTNHILDSKPYADLILKPYSFASRINKWDEKYNNGLPLTWWFANYYAATLDRTMQVESGNKQAVNNGN